ncbi:DUF4091 domain-containing protein [Parafilimonas terrae]|uniref:Uncharacterized protein n=1 Tax=Parafilimonas terrae TaxID=1465490 RepID=A0A1I5X3M9_9BACT|nr:DUF4091 domain-containing protein [Parafilimonas terrae]SFQ26625.1 protein of unknown function [Parafilimonas terrae]
MNQQLILSVVISFLTLCCNDVNSQNPGLEKFGDITSISQPNQQSWQQMKNNFSFSPVDINTPTNYNRSPVINDKKQITTEGWAGETVNVKFVVSSKTDINSLKVTASNLVSSNGAASIDAKNISVGYIYYVLADNSAGVCKKKEGVTYKTLIVPDIIDFTSAASFVKSNTNRPVWISIKIPFNATAGNYTTRITANAENNISSSVNILLTINKNRLPANANKNFFLNLWQYPIAEAEYYNVKPWSEEHFNLMKPAMTRLKDAGQKVITTSFFWDLYNAKLRSADDMMIKVVKTTDGKWKYDFTNFDKWVEFMMGIGINQQIECFGIAPLNARSYYLDEKDNKIKFFSESVNGKMYVPFWQSYLLAFEQHLKEKNWFNITTLGIDEKKHDVLAGLIQFIKGINKDWKISFTGQYFPDLQNNIYDYSLNSNQQIPASSLAARKNKGFITTYYTACWEVFPNVFTISSHADATWLAWNAAYRNLDGYLRWAYDYFNKKILIDTRAGLASGDNILIYPHDYSSIRFEMLKDGIEDFLKIQIKQKQRNFSSQFNSTLSQFDFKKVSVLKNRNLQINNARQLLNK